MKQDSLKVKCDLQVSNNNKNHHTSDLSTESRLFLRRGQEFTIVLGFKKQLQLGKVSLITTTGPNPSKQNGTKNKFQISSLGNRKSWSARVTSSDVNSWTVAITCPANALIGNYTLSIKVTSTFHTFVQDLGKFMLLFNPWCSDDSVFLWNETQREEYILSEDGIIYLGTADCIQSHPWHFGQFEEEIADICIKVMDMHPNYQRDPEKNYLRRNDPVYISQVISDMISRRDEEDRVAHLVKNTTPSTTWISSVPILQQWFLSECQPIYGQHWVFAAVLCTVLRCLGIPTRVVTNFNSAHYTDRTLQKDKFYNELGARIHRGRNDSIWNFHVWNECWMERRNLPEEYSGWQVVDATAQQKYDGTMNCSGPAPVRAIKNGDVDINYDVHLIFSKVNTDCTVWVRNSEGFFTKALGDTRHVGESISTKSVGSNTRQDITLNYKYPKGSEEEYKVFQKVKQKLKNYKPEEDNETSLSPFIVSVTSQSTQLYGQDVEITATVTNISDSKQDLLLVVGAQSEYNYGITRAQFWKEEYNCQLSRGEGKSVSCLLSYSLYRDALMNNNLLRVTALVKQPKGVRSRFALAEQNVIVCKPALVLQMPKVAIQFQPTTAMAVFTNPLGEALRECVIQASGKGLLYKEREYWCDDVLPGGQLCYPLTFTPTLVGSRRLCVQLKSNKLKEIISYQKLEVLPANAQQWSPENWEEFQKSAKEQTFGTKTEDMASISVTLQSDDFVLYGQEIHGTVRVSNQSVMEKDLNILFYAQYVHENWNFCPWFWKEECSLGLSAKEDITIHVGISLLQYEDFPWESHLVRLTALVTDVTNTISSSKKITILKPDLIIQMHETAIQYQLITAKINITNPLEDTLDGCVITVSGESLIYRERSYRCSNCDPGTTQEYNITFTPTQTGALKLCVRFNCRQFCDVKISKSIVVFPSNTTVFRQG
ncbi:protein 4.2 [Bombina bombina]|uniref:protein 4.2 n=1 Tax=Bombina bombina TaxID=8345 RepID=UPI00235A8E7F|nr:protein 4.2 [Bombina bombina]